MAGAADARGRRVRRDVHERDRARRQLGPLRERAVELLERRVRVAEQPPGGAQGVARLAGQRRRLAPRPVTSPTRSIQPAGVGNAS